MEELLVDLAAEHDELDSLVAPLDEDRWDLATPAEGWGIRDQISHLAFFDEQAAQAAANPEAFVEELGRHLAGGVQGFLEVPVHRGREMDPPHLLTWWREARRRLLGAFRATDPERRLPWYGPPMRARSAAAARLMETWAHGQDVADALGVERAPSDRLRHVAELGVKTFRWSFTVHGLQVPERKVRVALRGPSGATWVWNEGAEESITGPAEDFCLVVAQRRNHLSTRLVVEGPVARRWMEVAQVFAGPPGSGRPPEPPAG